MWPTPQDYNEAVQNPALCFADPDLRQSSPQLNALGLPKPMSGSFASVYQMNGRDGSQWAVRFFLQNFRDQSERYRRMTAFLAQQPPGYTVRFQFLETGVRIHGNWYPILKMDWVSGDTMIEWIRLNLHDPQSLERLRVAFKNVCTHLAACGIAHGDLQHGNIMVVENYLKLVDYDGMYVPTLAGFGSHELGHRHYQHPSRSKEHFGPYLDNFAAWSIHTSLQCLVIDPSLWQTLSAGDECLLFRHEDYLQPLHSVAFKLLENHAHPLVRDSARSLRFLLTQPPDSISPLGEPLVGLDSLKRLDAPVLLPEWMQPSGDGGAGISQGPTPLFFGATTKFRNVDQDMHNAHILNAVGYAEPTRAPRLVVAPGGGNAGPPATSPIYSHSQPGPTQGSMQGSRQTSSAQPQPLQQLGAIASSAPASYAQLVLSRIQNAYFPTNTPPGRLISPKMAGQLAMLMSLVVFLAVAQVLRLMGAQHTTLRHPTYGLNGAPSTVSSTASSVVPMTPDPANRFAYRQYESARVLFERRQYASSLELLLPAYRSYKAAVPGANPDLSIALCAYQIGRCYLKLDQNQQAIPYLEEAKEAFDNCNLIVPEPTLLLAEAHANLHEYEQAGAVLERQLELARNTPSRSLGRATARQLESVAFAMLKAKETDGFRFLQSALSNASLQTTSFDEAHEASVQLQTLAAQFEKAADPDYWFAQQLRTFALNIVSKGSFPDRSAQLECLEGLKKNALLQGNTPEAAEFQKRIGQIQELNARQADQSWRATGSSPPPILLERATGSCPPPILPGHSPTTSLTHDKM